MRPLLLVVAALEAMLNRASCVILTIVAAGCC